jgi:hypothetical protein
MDAQVTDEVLLAQFGVWPLYLINHRMELQTTRQMASDNVSDYGRSK